MKLELDLLDNGLDFIIEGLKPTTVIWGKQLSDNKWKYSVLNIFSGIELILKEKLKNEHWSLIFQDVSSANKQKLIQGDFISVVHSDIIKRLKEICGININDISIDNLRKLRNKFEHFETRITIDECKQVIASALQEIINFIDLYIMSFATEMQLEKINHIKIMLFDFDAFVSNRLKKFQDSIDRILGSKSGNLVHCLQCYNESFVIFKDSNRNCKCFVCNNEENKNILLKNIRKIEKEEFGASDFLQRDEYDYKCLHCGSFSKVRYSPSYFLVGDEYKSEYFICFNCLHYETAEDIYKEKLKTEITELRKTHSTEEIIKILTKRIEE